MPQGTPAERSAKLEANGSSAFLISVAAHPILRSERWPSAPGTPTAGSDSPRPKAHGTGPGPRAQTPGDAGPSNSCGYTTRALLGPAPPRVGCRPGARPRRPCASMSTRFSNTALEVAPFASRPNGWRSSGQSTPRSRILSTASPFCTETVSPSATRTTVAANRIGARVRDAPPLANPAGGGGRTAVSAAEDACTNVGTIPNPRRKRTRKRSAQDGCPSRPPSTNRGSEPKGEATIEVPRPQPCVVGDLAQERARSCGDGRRTVRRGEASCRSRVLPSAGAMSFCIPFDGTCPKSLQTPGSSRGPVREVGAARERPRRRLAIARCIPRHTAPSRGGRIASKEQVSPEGLGRLPLDLAVREAWTRADTVPAADGSIPG